MNASSIPARSRSTCGVTVDDIAKRLIDYGFHAPTMSFPVPGTLMIEPTESESKMELDRFCEAMIAIRREIADIENGRWKVEASPLRHAPHTVHDIADDEWARPYTRAEGCFPAGTSRSENTGRRWDAWITSMVTGTWSALVLPSPNTPRRRNRERLCSLPLSNQGCNP